MRESLVMEQICLVQRLCVFEICKKFTLAVVAYENNIESVFPWNIFWETYKTLTHKPQVRQLELCCREFIVKMYFKEFLSSISRKIPQEDMEWFSSSQWFALMVSLWEWILQEFWTELHYMVLPDNQKQK